MQLVSLCSASAILSHKTTDKAFQTPVEQIYPNLNLLFENLIEMRLAHYRIYEKELWTAEDVALWLSVPVGTIRNWTSDGQLPFRKIGVKSVRYIQSEIRELFLSEKLGKGGSYGY